MKIIKDLTLLGSLFFLFPLCGAGQLQKENNEHGIGIMPNRITYFSNQVVFSDAFKQSMPWQLTYSGVNADSVNKRSRLDEEFHYYRSGTESRIPDRTPEMLQKMDLDEMGWIKSLKSNEVAYTAIFNNTGGKYPGGEYTCFYDGQGQLKFKGDASVIARTEGKIKIRVTPTNKGIFVILSRTDSSNYIRNIHLVPDFLIDSYEKEPFHPDFLNIMAPFSLVYFNEMLRIDDSSLTFWEQRTKTGSQTQASEKGMALEYAVQLANKLNVKAWFQVPHLAGDRYIYKMAELIKENLRIHLDFCIEYSHELGFWYTQGEFAAKQGIKLGLSNNYNTARARFAAEQSARVFRIFNEIFDNPKRVQKVLAHVDGHDDFLWKNIWRYADAYGMVQHFLGTLGTKLAEKTSQMSVDDILLLAEKTVSDPIGKEKLELIQELRSKGLEPMVFYGSQTLFASPKLEERLFDKLVRLFEEVNRQPQMYNIYNKFIQRWYDSGGSTFVHAGLVRQYDRNGNWSLLESMNQEFSNSPKYSAVTEFALTGKSSKFNNNNSTVKSDIIREMNLHPLLGKVKSHLGPRVDINGFFETGKVQIDNKTSQGESVCWTPHFVKGTPREKYYGVHLASACEDWKYVTFSFTPDVDGQVDLRLFSAASLRFGKASGKSDYTGSGTWPVWACFDTVIIKGGTIKNEGFEESDGCLPVNWEYTRERGAWPKGANNPMNSYEGYYWPVLQANVIRFGNKEKSNYVRVSNSGFKNKITNISAGHPVTITYRAKVENIEKDFDVRIGFNGLHNDSILNIGCKEIPEQAVFWRIDPWYPQWENHQRYEKSKAKMVFLSKASSQWQKQKLIIVPEKDGEIEMIIHGIRLEDKQSKQLIPWYICYDEFKVEGANVTNGDFERSGENDIPGWRNISIASCPGTQVLKSNTAGKSNKYVQVWYGNTLSTRLKNVKKGREIKISFLTKTKGFFAH